MVAALTAILLSHQAINQELPTLSATAFEIGTEYIWVRETISEIKTFGGKTKKSTNKVCERYQIIEVTPEPKYVPNLKEYRGSPENIERAKQRDHYADGKIRYAWWGLFEKDLGQVEPKGVFWTDSKGGDGGNIGRDEYVARHTYFEFPTMPKFCFAPISLTGLKKVNDVINVSQNTVAKVTQIIKVDGFDCMEIVFGEYRPRTMYFRLSDGLIQRVKDEVGMEHEFEIDGVLGSGKITERAYRLDGWPTTKPTPLKMQ